MIDRSARGQVVDGLKAFEDQRISAYELMKNYLDPHLNSQDVGLLQIARELACLFLEDFADESKIYAERPFDEREKVYLRFLESDELEWPVFKRRQLS